MENYSYEKDKDIFSQGNPNDQDSDNSASTNDACFDEPNNNVEYTDDLNDGSFRYTPETNNTYMNTNSTNDNEIISFKDWLIICLLNCIPIVNIIMVIVYLAKADTKKDQKNWAKAQLLLIAFGFIIGLVFVLLIGATAVSLLS